MTRFFIVLLIACIGLQAHADEKILSFHSDIQVAADGSMQVSETITVNAEGDRIQRGIYGIGCLHHQGREVGSAVAGFIFIARVKGQECGVVILCLGCVAHRQCRASHGECTGIKYAVINRECGLCGD